jgi:truncated hemoglobin YjbI
MDAKRWGVVAAIGLICLFFWYVVQPEPIPEPPSISDTPLPTVRPPGEKDPLDPSTWAPSTPAAPSGSSKEVVEEMQAIAQEAMEYRKEQEKDAAAWLKDFLAGSDIATETKETYRMRALANAQTGIKALEEKDYQTVMQEFGKALEDPNSSPTTQYYCLDYMRDAAIKLQDEEAYVRLSLAQAELLKNGDFSHMGFDKADGEATVVWAKDMAMQLRAIKDQAAFDQYVDQTMKEWKIPPERRGDVETDVREKIHDLRKRIFG